MRLTIFVTAIALAASSAAWAQSGSGAGDAPENKGSTGWTGGHPETGGATTGQKVEVNDGAEAKDQPVMATGEDLKGPPTQFPPSKTPE